MIRRYFKQCSVCAAVTLYPSVHLKFKHSFVANSAEFNTALNNCSRLASFKCYPDRNEATLLRMRYDDRLPQPYQLNALRKIYKNVLSGKFNLAPEELNILRPYSDKMRKLRYDGDLARLLAGVIRKRTERLEHRNKLSG
jgi:hypothetical protein